jgi:hypothetical protein
VPPVETSFSAGAHDEITVTDNALTRSWTVTRDYSRGKDQGPVWLELACAENNPHARIGSDNFT